MADNDPQGATPEPKPDDDGMTTDAGRRALQAERDRVKELERQIADLKPLADKAKADEQANKSELERLTEQVTQLTRERDAATADRDRFQVALDKGLSLTQAKRLVGANLDEFTADADALITDLGIAQAEEPSTSSGATPGKPTESLRGGGDPTQEPPVDVRAVVDSIPRGF